MYEEGCFKCLFDGCGKTFKDKQTYIAHRGGVHWQGALDKYISERGKDINVDGEWPEGDIKWMKVKKDSPVASTPINGSSKKKRGRPPSFNTPDAPCSPATKKKPKDITVGIFFLFNLMFCIERIHGCIKYQIHISE